MTMLSKTTRCSGLIVAFLNLVSLPSSHSFLPSRPTFISAPSLHHLPASAVATTQGQNDTTSEDGNNTPEAPKFNRKKLLDFNCRLNELAEQIEVKATRDPATAPVPLATQVEKEWRQAVADPTEFIPDKISLNTVLKAWSRCVQAMMEASKRGFSSSVPSELGLVTAFDVAQHMEELIQECANSGLRPDRTTYNVLLDSYAKTRHVDAIARMQTVVAAMANSDEKDHSTPDLYSYNALADAYAHQVEVYWDALQSLWKRICADDELEPNVRTLNAILHGYSRQVGRRAAGDSEEALQLAMEARRILQEASSTDSTSYTTVLDAFARVGSGEAALQAEEVYQELFSRYEKAPDSELYRPSVYTFTSLIQAWARSNDIRAPARADHWLEVGRPIAAPNAYTYTAVIQAWARSPKPEKATVALELMKKMRKEGGASSPSLMTYHAALEACVRTRSPGDTTLALKIAFALYKALAAEKTMSPVPRTFDYLLRAVSSLLPAEERPAVVQAVWKQATAQGCAGDKGLQMRLRQTVDMETVRQVLETSSSPPRR